MSRAEVITSARNPLLKEVRRALSRGTLTSDGLCVAETFHLLEEALRSGLETPVVVASDSVRGVVERHVGKLRDIRMITVPDAVFQEISATETAQGVLALVKPPQWTMDHVLRGHSLVVVLDGVQDPGNAGAMARAAEAFGATGLLLLKGTVSPWNAKTLRASAGSLFRVPFLDGVDPDLARKALLQHKVEIFVAAPRAALSLKNATLSGRCALVIGSEGRGVSKAMDGAGLSLHIPTTGVESLNAAMAAGILLYEAWRQRTVE
ncbi:RNA methyltransferase [uncultured Paludibaculum sp.]|uniref:TrmH family RNA methyltransferase n=1 Tax=uncultured Paludibaculum sp. TaxID=1765020 RepID=UPI002AAAA319|nr:RNA methyltransferase [uncultured Paludibaculum sp.]